MTDIPVPAYRLHHVGIIVEDLESGVRTYRELGFAEPERTRIEEQQVDIATFRAGDGYVELVSPIVSEGGLVRYLESRGESVHHIAYQVDDIHGAIDHAIRQGFQMIDTVPRTGAHGWLVAFIHPKSCHGVLTELVQVTATEV